MARFWQMIRESLQNSNQLKLFRNFFRYVKPVTFTPVVFVPVTS